MDKELDGTTGLYLCELLATDYGIAGEISLAENEGLTGDTIFEIFVNNQPTGCTGYTPGQAIMAWIIVIQGGFSWEKSDK